MKRTLALATTLLAALTLSARLNAQQHTRYKLIDLGTLGGPNSSVPIVFYEINGTVGAQAINSQGTVIAVADTSTLDPLCFLDDCFYPGTLEYRNGAFTDLSALPGGQGSSPNWINDNGAIAGVSLNGQTDSILGLPAIHAVAWRSQAITDLGTLSGGSISAGWAINNRGQVVGFSTNGIADRFSYYYLQILGSVGGTQTRAFIWDNQNGMQDLGTLGGPDSWAGQINNKGQVTGISYTSDIANADNATCFPGTPTQDPFFWDRGTGMIDIGSFGGTCGVTNALNSRGQVVGQSYLLGNAIAHAFLWDKNANPQLLDLGTLGGDNAAGTWINDAGEVVGYADVPNVPSCSGLLCVHHGFLWKNGVMTDLGSIGTDPCSRAFSINSSGQIVGASAAICGGNLTHGFLWEQSGPAVDLNTLVAPGSGLSLIAPISINNRGEIAGYGMLANGDSHAFVLIPCDESTAGCATNGTSTTAPGPGNSTLTMEQRLAVRRMMAGPRTRLQQRYHIPSLMTPKN